MSPLRRAVAVVATAALVAALVVVSIVTIRVRTSPPTGPGVTVLAISAPTRTTAGSSIVVTLQTEGTGDVVLHIVDAFATTMLTRRLDAPAPEVNIVVPTHLTTVAGTITWQATGTRGTTISATTVVEAAGPHGPLDLLVGPRTIVADGADETMAVAIGVDRFGNPLADGTRLVVSTIDHAGMVQRTDIAVSNGVAAARVPAGTRAGRIEAFVSTVDERVTSRRVSYDEVPGPAAHSSIAIEADADSVPADGRSRLALQTAVLTDDHGNRLVDGRLVRIDTSGPDGVGQLTARTIDGVARFELVAPREPGAVVVVAVVDGQRSAPLEIDAFAAVSDLAFSHLVDEHDNLVVHVGPVRDAAGALVTDGTAVEVSIDDIAVSENLIDGRAEVVISAADRRRAAHGIDGRIDVTVLGITTSEAV